MKTLAKTLISSLTPALLLGLSGCSIHVHGKSEGHTGDGTKTAGGEHAKPAPKPDRKVVRATPKPAQQASDTPKPVPKPTPAPAPKPAPVAGIDAGGALGGGKVNTEPKAPIDTSAVSGGAKPPTPTPVDTSGISAGVKPTKPVDTSGISAGVKPTKPVDTSGISAGVKPTKPVDTSGISAGVKPTKPIDTSGISAGVKPTKPVDASGVSGGVAVTPDKKPIDNSAVLGDGKVKPGPVDAAGSINAGGKVNTRSPESIAAEKVAAEGKRERGDRDLPSGTVASGGEKKPPTPAPVTKDQGSNKKPGLQLPKPDSIKPEGSAVAMVPKNGEGKGQVRTPVLVSTVSCKLSVKELKQGEKLRVRGQGFADGAKVTVGGIAIPVTATKPTQIDAQLPKELENGGDVAVSQGNVTATCGKLKINPNK